MKDIRCSLMGFLIDSEDFQPHEYNDVGIFYGDLEVPWKFLENLYEYAYNDGLVDGGKEINK